eukprot:TRINITY_DN5763_c0_g1_i2.p1 TRINITY_DN5763_c0_g1~~TRINITY_DN5763_c0_g1_i2.p1  ORF type:complete len:333 (+),score=76.80 TRINITY_DN5763_c0_g1_i2:172-1170(+)
MSLNQHHDEPPPVTRDPEEAAPGEPPDGYLPNPYGPGKDPAPAPAPAPAPKNPGGYLPNPYSHQGSTQEVLELRFQQQALQIIQEMLRQSQTQGETLKAEQNALQDDITTLKEDNLLLSQLAEQIKEANAAQGASLAHAQHNQRDTVGHVGRVRAAAPQAPRDLGKQARHIGQQLGGFMGRQVKTESGKDKAWGALNHDEKVDMAQFKGCVPVDIWEKKENGTKHSRTLWLFADAMVCTNERKFKWFRPIQLLGNIKTCTVDNSLLLQWKAGTALGFRLEAPNDASIAAAKMNREGLLMEIQSRVGFLDANGTQHATQRDNRSGAPPAPSRR